MSTLLEFGLLSFTSLFTMVNPLGVIPLYIGMTSHLPARESQKIAAKATFMAAIILILFALTGKFLFDFFGISVHSLRIVGGVIFFIMGYEMLQARLSKTKHDNMSDKEFANDIAITPLAIPMICGPGAITTVIIFMNDSPTLLHKGLLFISVILICGLTYILLKSGKRIIQALGESGNKVLLRLMGLIVMVIAVEFFFSGLKPIVQDILNINATGL